MFRLLALVCAVLTVSAAPAVAQQAAATPPAPTKEEEATTLAGLTVTAQKREEALQDVPISITALARAAAAGHRRARHQGPAGAGPRPDRHQHPERGADHRAHPRHRHGRRQRRPGISVGVVIDGVYRPRNGVGFGDLGEIERIEVLKGPQGTVFGKNTSAGVINIITAGPATTPRVEGELTVGNYGAWRRRLATTTRSARTPHSASTRPSASATASTTCAPAPARAPRPRTATRTSTPLRGQLLFEPTDNLDISLIADFTSREENCCVGVTTVRGAHRAPSSTRCRRTRAWRRWPIRSRASPTATAAPSRTSRTRASRPRSTGSRRGSAAPR